MCFNLTPLEPARLVVSPQNTEVFANRTVVLTCTAFGIPSPTVSWYREDSLLMNDTRVSIDTEDTTDENENTFVASTLRISSTEESDSGSYNCSVDNGVGSDSTTFELTVRPCKEKSLLKLAVTFFSY